MQIPSGTNYIDTCALLMLLNKKDDLRTALGLKDKPAKSIIRKNLLPLRIPMPALGEVLKKARDKGIDWDEVTSELDSLITEKILEITYIKESCGVFYLANQIESNRKDDRDKISPMDALIAACAIKDTDCKAMFTSDGKLLSDSVIQDLIESDRDASGSESMDIKPIEEMLKHRGVCISERFE